MNVLDKSDDTTCENFHTIVCGVSSELVYHCFGSSIDEQLCISQLCHFPATASGDVYGQAANVYGQALNVYGKADFVQLVLDAKRAQLCQQFCTADT
jgi:hypothetical protein